MTRTEIGAYRASDSLVFGGQVHKSLDVDKNLNYHCHWVKNITLECCRFCPTNGVHLKYLSKSYPCVSEIHLYFF